MQWKLVFKFIFVLGFATFVSCGKNEAVRSTSPYNYPPVQPPVQAPPPNGGYPGMPGGGGYPPGGGYFNPQIPPQMPPQFYPFMPVYVYLVQQPQIWVTVWTGWQQAAPYYGCGTYDFSCFWYDYCGGSFGGYYPEAYSQMSSSVYYWMQPGMQFDPYVDSGYFWGNYSCGGGCY